MKSSIFILFMNNEVFSENVDFCYVEIFYYFFFNLIAIYILVDFIKLNKSKKYYSNMFIYHVRKQLLLKSSSAETHIKLKKDLFGSAKRFLYKVAISTFLRKRLRKNY